MAANKVATLAQTLMQGVAYSQVAVSGIIASYPAGSSLQIGSDGAPNLMVTLAVAATLGDEVLHTGSFVPAVGFVSGIGIFDPTSSTGAEPTANRPGGATVGAQFYDTTLGKPIWFNGTVWTDATGTPV